MTWLFSMKRQLIKAGAAEYGTPATRARGQGQERTDSQMSCRRRWATPRAPALAESDMVTGWSIHSSAPRRRRPSARLLRIRQPGRRRRTWSVGGPDRDRLPRCRAVTRFYSAVLGGSWRAGRTPAGPPWLLPAVVSARTMPTDAPRSPFSGSMTGCRRPGPAALTRSSFTWTSLSATLTPQSPASSSSALSAPTPSRPRTATSASSTIRPVTRSASSVEPTLTRGRRESRGMPLQVPAVDPRRRGARPVRESGRVAPPTGSTHGRRRLAPQSRGRGEPAECRQRARFHR